MKNSLNYNVVFNEGNNSNSKYFNADFEYCKNWISKHNGTSYSYFEYYNSGTVSIVNKETQEVVFETKILNTNLNKK